MDIRPRDGAAEPVAAWDLTAILASAEGIERAVCGLGGAWGSAASVGLMVLHSFPVPTELLAVANGMCFGLALGVAVTWAGAMLGALLAFGLTRRLGRPFVRRVLAERHRRRADAWAERGGAGALLLARLIPVIAFDLINYAAGLVGVGRWRFAWTTALGILPASVASVLVGSHMLRAPWWAWAALAGAVALVAAAQWRWWRTGR